MLTWEMNEINEMCEIFGRKGSVVKIIFPVGWEKNSLYEDNDEAMHFNVMYNGKYRGFKGVVVSEIRNCRTLLTEVNIMGKNVWFLASQLEFIILKDNRKKITEEIERRYALEAKAYHAELMYKRHKYSWE